MKKMILALMAIFPLLSVNAQENSPQEQGNERAAINTTWEVNRFRDNWFISIGGGIADLMSEESRYVDFGDRIKPTVSFSVGKWMSPVWGLRLNVTGAELQGFATWSDANLGLGSWYIGTNHPMQANLETTTNSYLPVFDGKHAAEAQFVRDHFLRNARSTSKGNGFDYTIKYVGASLDFIWNLNNTFRPYNPNRFFNINLFGGPAFAHTFKEDSELDGSDYQRTAVNTVGVKAGLQTTFRLSSAVDFFLEGQTYVLPEMFDRRVGDGNTMDGVLSVLGGFTIKFPNRSFNKPEPVYIDRRPIEPVVIPQRDDCCDELRARLQRIEDLLNKQPEPKVIEIERLKVVIHFVIDRYEVRPTEMFKLEEIAAFMNRHPQVRVSISGFADVQTGNPAHNMRLSERRCNEVVRLLTTKFNVSRDRLTIKAFGDTVQPFAINELNRAVIAVDIE